VATWSLSASLLLLFAGEIVLMSFASDLAATTPFKDSVITVALLYAVALVVAAAVITALYAWWASERLDPLTEQVRKEIAGEESLG